MSTHNVANDTMASSPHQEQQQQEQSAHERQEEYLAAQRAAVEAVYVGRETLQRSVEQGEQLRRAETLGGETQYKLDKAGRVLRGMTWSGWVANMFTKPVGAPPEAGVSSSSSNDPPLVYDYVPSGCQETAQAVQNYHANVKVLEACETDEQKETCATICDTMLHAATKALDELKANYPKLEAYAFQFEKDVDQLRRRQKFSQEQTRKLGHIPASSTEGPNRAELFSSASSEASTKTASAIQQECIDPRQQEQDQHLAIMAQSLGELGSIAQNLQQSMNQQGETIDSLDSMTDNITEKTRMVTRRADRLVQKRSWTPVKPTFHSYVAIRHIQSGRYLAALDAKDLYLVPRFHPLTCVFALWKRQGSIFGIKNKHSSRWAGQSLFGTLASSATSFGRREEWEAGDDDWSNTQLLCASAGWGAGGYLQVREKDFGLVIGGCTVEDRNKADHFQILEQDVAALPTELQD